MPRMIGRGVIDYRRPTARTRGGGSSYLDSLYRNFQTRETGARKANLARETEVRGTYDELIARSQSGGAFRASEEARIGREKTQEIGLGTVGAINSGMFSTTNLQSIGTTAANRASVKQGTLESVLERMTQQLKLGKAAFVERIEDPYPDYGLLVQAMAARAQA